MSVYFIIGYFTILIIGCILLFLSSSKKEKKLEKKKTVLWLDDIRNPYEDKWYNEYLSGFEPCKITWVKTYIEFCNFISKNGIPDVMCFDNDLGTFTEGKDCAKFTVEYILDRNIKKDFRVIVQSSNPVAKEFILDLFKNLNKFR